MKQLLAWTGSADSTITSEAVMAMAEKFNTGQEVCLQIPSARGVMQVKEGTSGSCVDGARGSRDFLAISLRSGASHVSGLFARRTWPLALM
jgi:hypothetical protein